MANLTSLKPATKARIATAEESSESELDGPMDSLCNESNDEDEERRPVHRSSSTSLKVRAQKMLAGRVANSPNTLKPIIGSRAMNALKSAERLLKAHWRSKEDVKKTIRYTIKTIAKLGVVVKQNALSSEQLRVAQSLKKQFQTIACTIISFARTDYTYNREFLDKLLLDCQTSLRMCVHEVLSNKSHQRIEYVFSKLRDPKLLDDIFSPMATTQQRQALSGLTDNLAILLTPASGTPRKS